jgi:hypothetical protein
MKTKSNLIPVNKLPVTLTVEEILFNLLEFNLYRPAVGQTTKAVNDTKDEED